MLRCTFALLSIPALLATPVAADTGTLVLFASGEDLATEGFAAPKLTRDGWALDFTRIIATFGDIAAHQTEPPFMADGPEVTATATVAFPGTFTVDLVDADDADLVELTSVTAPVGFYNALTWTLMPADSGDAAGFSLWLEGTATRDGQSVDFVLSSRDTQVHACGEFVGDARQGFVTAGGGSALEMTLHLDHLFGRADKPADDAMNLDALGFDAFASGGMHEIALAGLHLGHVGEGHCHVENR